MPNELSVTLVLVGALAGKTIVLNGHRFVEGRCMVRAPAEQVSYSVAYMARSYNAHPLGSLELKAAQEAIGHGGSTEANGVTNGQSDAVRSDGGSDGGELADTTLTIAGEPSDGPAQSAGKSNAGGDGVSDSWVPPSPAVEAVDPPSPEADARIRGIVMALAPEIDDHWTDAGLPKVSAVQEGYGRADVTRKMIEAAAPGWNRDQARDFKKLTSSGD